MAFLLILSALFAGSETALFTVARNKSVLQEERNRKANSPIIQLLNKPSQLLMTLLLSNLMVNLCFFFFNHAYRSGEEYFCLS
ncbi:MAG: DUF21 domain-containing protein [Planctomycetes bacterium]|nr:DUF21 domain-containing protein [Planctomycetota bacterium]